MINSIKEIAAEIKIMHKKPDPEIFFDYAYMNFEHESIFKIKKRAVEIYKEYKKL